MKEFWTRILIAMIGIPAVIGLIYLGDIYLTGLVIIVSLIAIYELTDIVAKKDIPVNRLNTSAAAIAILITAGINPPMLIYILPITLIYILTTMLIGKVENSFQSVASSTFTIIYIPINLSFFLMIRQLPDHGYNILLLGLIVIWVCDSFAYIFGSLLGTTSITPQISPNKTITGSLAGLAGSLLVVYLFHYLGFVDFELLPLLGLGLITGIFAQLGDLIESVLKRDTGVDDSSDLLLGHGGILDRIDSILLASPVLYLYAQIFLL